MVFSRRTIYFPLVPVLLQNSPVPYSFQFKFLGVILDHKLNWKAHINRIQSKLSSLCGILYRLRNRITRSVARILYLPLGYVYISYCNSIWSSCSASLMQSLFVTQKKIVRLIMKTKRNEPSSPLFKKLALLQLKEVNNLNTAIYVYKSINNIIPSPITFEYRTLGPYNLRRREPLMVPFARSKQSQRFLLIRGANLWNALPAHMKEYRTLYSFKQNLKQSYLLSYN